MDSIKPLRCLGIKEAILADDGTAVLIELVMENGQIFPLELDTDGVDLLTRVMLMAAKAMGPKGPERAPLTETAPSEAVQMEADDVAVRAHADGPVLALRVGSIDVTLKLPNQVLANAMASAIATPGKA